MYYLVQYIKYNKVYSMDKQYKTLQQKDIDFIKKQKLFYLVQATVPIEMR